MGRAEEGVMAEVSTSQAARRKALGLACAMAAGAALAWWRKPTRQIDPARPPLPLESIFPMRFGVWQADAGRAALVRPADEQGKLYGVYDQVLERIYSHPDGLQMMLSVAYGTEQSVGLQVHRPEVCYASGGFQVSRVESVTLALADRALPATRLLATQPGRSEPITYWALLGERVQRDERSFRWQQLAFGLRGQLQDGMVVRLSTLDRDVDRAWAQQAHFARELVAALPTDLRVRVVGRPDPR